MKKIEKLQFLSQILVQKNFFATRFSTRRETVVGQDFNRETRKIYHKIFEYKVRFTQKVSEVRFLDFLCYNMITYDQKLVL